MTNTLLVELGRHVVLVDCPSEPARSGAELTARERAVLALVAQGLSTREVATRLAYSERTIKNVLQEVTTRLNLRNRTQAVAFAVRAGWI